PTFSRNPPQEECWKRFIRIEKNGSIEYCEHAQVSNLVAMVAGKPPIKVFHYVQIIAVIWTFLYAAKRILSTADYDAGVRLTINFVGATNSILDDFSATPGEVGKEWQQPFDVNSPMSM